jgi:hypothetical protein
VVTISTTNFNVTNFYFLSIQRIYVFYVNSQTLLGAFAKLRKAISVAMSVCLSVRMKQLDSHSTDFDEISNLSFFPENLSRKFKFH